MSNAGGNLVTQIIGGVMLLMAVYYIAKFQPNIVTKFFYRYSLISFVLISVFASIFWSVETTISFRRVVALTTIFMFSIVIAETYSPGYVLQRVARAIAYCAIAGFVYVLVDPGNALVNEGIRESAFLGIFYDKNGGARAYAYAAIILFRGVTRFSRKDILLFFVLLIAILYSQSATALVLTVVGCGLVSFFVILNSASSRLQARRQVYSGVVLLLAGLLIAYLFFEFILYFLGRDPTLTNRTIIWELLWPSVEERLYLG